MRYLIIAVTCLTVFSGCATQMPQPEATYPEGFVIRTVRINPNVSIVDKPLVQTPASLWGNAVGGIIGATIASGGTREEQFVSFLKSNNIDLKEIVLKSFNERLSSPNSPIVTAEDRVDVELEIFVLFYGIHGAEPFSFTSLEPMLEVGVKVVDANGKHIRNVSEAIKFPSDEVVPPHTMEEYTASPSLLLDGYTKLSDVITESIVNQLSSSGSI